ncbi:ParB/RepB/Spo0J family partition protein [Chitinophaga sp. CC14]|uniref:ParB/RepB/Spo0J family partition protein n=1 Tax=Chitinophaga sp. CC14 TaxID=3029199 RepID=UPI003B7D384C
MKTTIKKTSANKSTRQQAEQQPQVISQNESAVAEQKSIPLSQVDLSPDNYRIYFSPAALDELAADISLHGMISPVTVRPMSKGRYELVVGERRIRAARIAALEMIPAVITNYTDEQAEEIRMAENLQRENPHPMDEANRIGKMQRDGKTIVQIAERLSKSKAFVYSRIKLSQLITQMQEIFFAGKLTLSEAMEIAGLAPSSQAEIFERHCQDWNNENFSIGSFRYVIGRYKYDLNDAPFDVQDTQLLPCAGACSSCPFNSATLSTLFPEMAAEAICTNKACYHDKCLAQSQKEVLQALENVVPDGIVFSGSLSEENKIIIDSLEQTAGLPQYAYYDVTVITQPTAPDKEDYTDGDEEGENETFDEEGYELALQEYDEDLASYNERINGEVLKGLYFSYHGVKTVFFSPEKRSRENSPKQATAKQVQEAIKQGTATPELLQGELLRLQHREERSIQIDRDKVQQAVHQKLSDTLDGPALTVVANAADLTAARLLVYQSLNYESRSRVNNSLLVDENLTHITDPERIYRKLASLTESEYCWMIRLALAGNGESKIPTNVNGIALYHLADKSGISVQEIEKQQAKIAKTRLKKLKPRLKNIEDRIKTMGAASERKEAA